MNRSRLEMITTTKRRASSPQTKPSTTRTCEHGLSLIRLFAFGVLVLAVITPAAAQIAFDRYEIVPGAAKHQTVLTGTLLGGTAADIAVVNVLQGGERRLAVYGLDAGRWERKIDSELGSDALFVDVANIGGHDRLLIFKPGQLSWFDPDSGAEIPLVTVAPVFNPPLGGGIPRVDISRDLNGNGRDDLVVPAPDGFHVYLQADGGSFSGPLKLGPPDPFRDKIPFGIERTYGEIGWTAQTNPVYQKRVHLMDFDRDGRSDLAFWNKDHFDIYSQDEDGSFEEKPERFSTGVAFDWDGTYSVMFRTGKEKRITVLHSVSDLNGDGIADLLVFSMNDVVSRGSKNRRRLARGSFYKVHFGKPAARGTGFSPDADVTIKPRGMQVDLLIRDLDGDGRSDLMLTSFKLGISSIFRVVFARKTNFGLQFYRMDGAGYPKKPNAVRKFTSGMDPFDDSKESFYPFILIGDVNGDRRSDLLMAKGRDEMQVFKGVEGPGLFERKAQKIDVDNPIDEQYTRLVDLNMDGKQDLLMHHLSDTGPHKLAVLISR